MNKKKQEKVFAATIGGDEVLFREERLLEGAISQAILTCPKDKRDIAYRECYEKLHNFFVSATGGDHLYTGANLHRALWKKTFIGKLVGKNQKVLEVGCGEGILSIALAKSGNRVTGTDISDTCILLANKNKLRFRTEVDFLRMSATRLDFPPNTFDWVVSTDLLEHLHPDDALNHLFEAARILKNKGKYLLITPNASVGLHAGSLHLKEYTLKELKELFARAGFVAKAPLFHFVNPLNLVVRIEIKLILQKLSGYQGLAYTLLGLDPIVLILCKQS